MSDKEKIKEYINMSIRQRDNYCKLNDCEPTSYINGALDAYNDILKYIDELTKKH